MPEQDPKILRIQVSHPFLGSQNFDLNSKETFADLRSMLAQHTQMTVFDNYGFEVGGKGLAEGFELGQAIGGDTRVGIVMRAFDERTSYYHLERVREVLANPVQWVMLNSRETYQQKQLPNPKLPPELTLDNFLDTHLTSPLHATPTGPEHPPQFLQNLTFSLHNPPPMYRKLAGDFYYLQVKTLEGYEEHVTACPQGFYVNNSSNSCFNTANSSGIYYYNLFDLFVRLSPKFKQLFYGLNKLYKVTELDKAIFSSYKMPPLCSWLKSVPDSSTPKKGKTNQWKYYNPSLPAQNTIIKDWNEMMQINSVVPGDTELQICGKEKNQYKLYQEFAVFASQAAVKTVEGHICGGNGSVGILKDRAFGYGTVNIWIAEDEPTLYRNYQGKKLTRRALNAQLRNLELLENYKPVHAHFKHMVVVNYRGYNVVVEAMVPNAPAERKKIDDNQGKREKIVQDVAKWLRIQPKNLYKNPKGEVQRALIHPQLRTLQGDDSRSYLLNLYTLSARDLNFPTADNNATYFRRQLITIFNERQNCHKNINTMIESGQNIITNERVGEQGMKLQSLKAFAQEIMVPLCIQSFLKNNKKYLADSKNVVKVMHKFGLSSRYLGSLHHKAPQYEASHIRPIIQRVVLAKCLKNIIRLYLRKAQLGDLKSTISRILNCIFCGETAQNALDESLCKEDTKDQISTNASRRKKKKIDFCCEGVEDQIVIKIMGGSSQIRPMELWQQIKQTAYFRYGLKFTQNKIYYLTCLSNQFSKTSLLRDICITTGLTLQKCEYFQKQGIIFKPENIDQLRPLSKHITLKNKHLKNLIIQGDQLIEKKRIQEAIDMYNQAINYASTNFGIMTEELAMLNKKIAEIYFRIGEIDAAVLFGHCGQKMCERIYGESHVQTLECYNLLSQFNFFIRNFETSEYYCLKSLHLSTISYGEQYPQLIPLYLNLSTVYQSMSRHMDSITCISHALRIVLRVFGQVHLTTAICYAAMSTAHYEVPDIGKAIEFQEKSMEIMGGLMGDEDGRLREARRVLEYYRHLQSSKKVKESCEKERKKMISNPQLYAGFPLFRMPEYPRQREIVLRKLQGLGQFPVVGGKLFF